MSGSWDLAPVPDGPPPRQRTTSTRTMMNPPQNEHHHERTEHHMAAQVLTVMPHRPDHLWRAVPVRPAASEPGPDQSIPPRPAISFRVLLVSNVPARSDDAGRFFRACRCDSLSSSGSQPPGPRGLSGCSECPAVFRHCNPGPRNLLGFDLDQKSGAAIWGTLLGHINGAEPKVSPALPYVFSPGSPDHVRR